MRPLSPAEARAALDSGDVDAVLSSGGLRSKEQPDDKLTGVLDAAAREVRQAGRAARRRAPGRRAAAGAAPADGAGHHGRAGRPGARPQGRASRSSRCSRSTAQLLDLRLPAWPAAWWRRSPRASSRCCSPTIRPTRPAGRQDHRPRAARARPAGGDRRASGWPRRRASGALDVERRRGRRRRARGRLVRARLRVLLRRCSPAPGALVPRQEELQASMTPLTMLILISFFCSFAVLDDPDGTLAHVSVVHPVQRADHDAAADRARRGAGASRSSPRSPSRSRAALR